MPEDPWRRDQIKGKFNERAVQQEAPLASNKERPEKTKHSGPELNYNPPGMGPSNRPIVVDNSGNTPSPRPVTPTADFQKAASPWETRQADLDARKKAKSMDGPSKGSIKDDFNRKSK